jgi:hypothetical protein
MGFPDEIEEAAPGCMEPLADDPDSRSTIGDGSRMPGEWGDGRAPGWVAA